MQESVITMDCFAATLARLHNLKVNELEIKSLRFPKDNGCIRQRAANLLEAISK